MAWANDEWQGDAGLRKNGGDARGAMIGVAHNRLRFAAGKMSGEQTEKTNVTKRVPTPVLGSHLPDDHPEWQAVLDFEDVDHAVLHLVEEFEELDDLLLECKVR